MDLKERAFNIANQIKNNLIEKNPSFEGINNYDPALDLIESVSARMAVTEEAFYQTQKANNIHTATGIYLERIAAFFGLERKKEETDDVFRKRILFFISSLSQKGTLTSLLARVLSISELIKDAYAFNSFEDPIIINKSEKKAGLVYIYPLFNISKEDRISDREKFFQEEGLKSEQEEYTKKIEQEKNIKTQIEKSLNSKDFAPIGAIYEVRSPKIYLWEPFYKVVYQENISYSKPEIEKNIIRETISYFDDFSKTLGGTFRKNELLRRIEKIGSVFYIEEKNLPAIKVLEKNESFHIKNEIAEKKIKPCIDIQEIDFSGVLS